MRMRSHVQWKVVTVIVEAYKSSRCKAPSVTAVCPLPTWHLLHVRVQLCGDRSSNCFLSRGYHSIHAAVANKTRDVFRPTDFSFCCDHSCGLHAGQTKKTVNELIFCFQDIVSSCLLDSRSLTSSPRNAATVCRSFWTEGMGPPPCWNLPEGKENGFPMLLNTHFLL